MSFRFPYLSLDIETTGLDLERSHVLQLAAVYDDGRPFHELNTNDNCFTALVKWDHFDYAEPYALYINRELFKTPKAGFSLDVVKSHFNSFLKRVQPEGRFYVCGKNAGTFDLPVLRNKVNGFDLSRFHHRVMDVGSMYLNEFDHVPSISELNKFLGRGEVAHEALADCFDVVAAVRHHWGV